MPSLAIIVYPLSEFIINPYAPLQSNMHSLNTIYFYLSYIVHFYLYTD